MATTRTHCTGTSSVSEQEAKSRGLIPLTAQLYGRRVCTTCGNAANPKRNGDLRQHMAKPAFEQPTPGQRRG